VVEHHLLTLEGPPHRVIAIAFIAVLAKRLKRLVAEDLTAWPL
jgi:hypothetical protein